MVIQGRGVVLRNVAIKKADKTFILENVEGLQIENVTIAGQAVNGRLDWKAGKNWVPAALVRGPAPHGAGYGEMANGEFE